MSRQHRGNRPRSSRRSPGAGSGSRTGPRSGARSGARTLRPLGGPRPVRVHTDPEGTPLAVEGRRGPVHVAAIREVWQVDDEWWRAPISRVYHAVVLEGGRLVTLFLDQAADPPRWYAQPGAH